ncbi:MAG: helix-turn-helix transcriptional regulator [Tannerellaceae bacterium]|jgi:DNA-binding CsgD family transcriptional regulator|nr:helix-turn-helix transcriptional regulator [Tannerellaceae bacterium]
MYQLKETEFYNTPNGDVMIKTDQEPLRILEETGDENRAFISSFISYISTFYTEAWNTLCLLYSKKEPNRLNYEYWITSRFIRCNFGEYDANAPDIDIYGRFHFEEVKCPLRGECPYENIICKPAFNSSLSFRETNVLRLVIQRYKVEEIASNLHISPHTVRNHIRNIHIKSKTQSIADLVDYWHTHNLK